MTSPCITDRFAFHRSTPQITVDEYERRRVIELGEWVAARDRIYLDKCFWIHLRAVRTLASSPPGAADLLDALVAGVSNGQLVCPISDVLFLEVTGIRSGKNLFSTISGLLVFNDHFRLHRQLRGFSM